MSPEDVIDKIRSELSPEPKHVPGSAIAQSVGGIVDSTTGKVHPGPPSPGFGSALPSSKEEPKSRGIPDLHALGPGDDTDRAKKSSKDKKDTKSAKDNKDPSKPKGPKATR